MNVIGKHIWQLLTLSLIVLPANATRYEVGDYVFDCNYISGQFIATLLHYRGNATEVTIPESVEFDGHLYPLRAIGDEFSQPFMDNTSMVQLTIPATVTNIGPQAFMGCRTLQTVKLNLQLESIGDYAFYGCKELQHVTMYRLVKTIGAFAFAYCDQLQNLQMGRGVRTLGIGVFDHTPLRTLTLISANPIACSGPLSYAPQFYEVCTLEVPIGQRDRYVSFDGEWSKFATISEKAELGDINADGHVEIADVNRLINIILHKASATDNADINHDSHVDIADINELLNIILGLTGT